MSLPPTGRSRPTPLVHLALRRSNLSSTWATQDAGPQPYDAAVMTRRVTLPGADMDPTCASVRVCRAPVSNAVLSIRRSMRTLVVSVNIPRLMRPSSFKLRSYFDADVDDAPGSRSQLTLVPAWTGMSPAPALRTVGRRPCRRKRR